MTQWTIIQQKGVTDFAHAGQTLCPGSWSTGSHECPYTRQTSVQSLREIHGSGEDQIRKEGQLTSP